MAGLGKRLTDLGLIPLRLAVGFGSAVLDRFEPERAEEASESEATEERRGARTDAPRRPPQRDPEPKPWLDDVALARKVESVIFRDPSVAKGKIDVNAADGVVWLRGEAKTPDLINELERQAASVPEARRVENLLHLPKTPAPSRADTPARQRRTRRSRPAPGDRKVKGRRVTAEGKRVQGAEETPTDLASEREGRKPPPLDRRSTRPTERRED